MPKPKPFVTRPPSIRGPVGHIFEFTVAKFGKKAHPSVPPSTNNQTSVLVEIRTRDAHAPTLAGQARLLCYVCEMQSESPG